MQEKHYAILQLKHYRIPPFQHTCPNERTLGFLSIVCVADSQQSAPADPTKCLSQVKNSHSTPPSLRNHAVFRTAKLELPVN